MNFGNSHWKKCWFSHKVFDNSLVKTNINKKPKKTKYHIQRPADRAYLWSSNLDWHNAQQ